tara:strand:- start:36 stop:671 length:636 start_codon:yes stop_codon:yes gene_type:complete
MILRYFDECHYIPASILDIGCNKGQFYELCKKKWGAKPKIVLIDGNTSLKETLDKLDVKYHLSLLSDKKRSATFYLTKRSKTGSGASLYREDTYVYDDDLVIKESRSTTTLDDLFKEDNKFDIIKLDTQGSELDIMRGGLSLCKKADYIILEVSLIEYNKGAPLKEEACEFMRSIGFSAVKTIGLKRPKSGKFKGKKIQEDIIFKNARSIL